MRFLSTLVGLVLACSSLSAFAQDTTLPPINTDCRCYLDVNYGTVTWSERGVGKMKQQYDIYMPDPAVFTGPRPIAFFGHANGKNKTTSVDFVNSGFYDVPSKIKVNSVYSKIVNRAVLKGYIVVSVEFRHPVVDFVKEGSPKNPDNLDFNRAVTHVANTFGTTLNADIGNTFFHGRSRGAGMSLLTALDQATMPLPAGMVVRGVWGAESQTTWNCAEIAQKFLIAGPTRTAWRKTCERTTPLDAASSLKAVRPATSIPVVTKYSGSQHEVMPMPPADFDIHDPEFGVKLCETYAEKGTTAACSTEDNITESLLWEGLVDFYEAYRQVGINAPDSQQPIRPWIIHPGHSKGE